MKVVSFDNTNISYTMSGDGDCLVFVHGWANNRTTWKHEIKHFKSLGYTVISLDLRGHGQSDKPDDPAKYSLESFAKDIKCILDKENVSKCVLIGHSMGGMISLKFCSMFPDTVSGMVLCDTMSQSVLEHKKVKVVSPFITKVLTFLTTHQHVRQNHFGHLANVDLSMSKGDYKIFCEGLHNTPLKSVFACLESMMNFDLRASLSKIHVPVLIIEGSEDSILPRIDSVEMFHHIKGAQLAFVPGTHFVQITQADEVTRLIQDFLER